ncbi:hypothetical protein DSO57_1006585 [Entomophthora muscae]|uniref:Uncharacterized protein n=1 Tax=Entomophthora muscae TaxID=34485 RepID=A0ACC2SL02_9FUNG|nr:hypothetical protein DSO57_1006585 [Entomophthora muscae]
MHRSGEEAISRESMDTDSSLSSDGTVDDSTLVYQQGDQAYRLPRTLYDAIFREGYLACQQKEPNPSAKDSSDLEIITVGSDTDECHSGPTDMSD